MKELVTNPDFWTSFVETVIVILSMVYSLIQTIKNGTANKQLNESTSMAVKSLSVTTVNTKKDIIEYKKIIEKKDAQIEELEKTVRKLVDHIDTGE